MRLKALATAIAIGVVPVASASAQEDFHQFLRRIAQQPGDTGSPAGSIATQGGGNAESSASDDSLLPPPNDVVAEESDVIPDNELPAPSQATESAQATEPSLAPEPVAPQSAAGDVSSSDQGSLSLDDVPPAPAQQGEWSSGGSDSMSTIDPAPIPHRFDEIEAASPAPMVDLQAIIDDPHVSSSHGSDCAPSIAVAPIPAAMPVASVAAGQHDGMSDNWFSAQFHTPGYFRDVWCGYGDERDARYAATEDVRHGSCVKPDGCSGGWCGPQTLPAGSLVCPPPAHGSLLGHGHGHGLGGHHGAGHAYGPAMYPPSALPAAGVAHGVHLHPKLGLGLHRGGCGPDGCGPAMYGPMHGHDGFGAAPHSSMIELPNSCGPDGCGSMYMDTASAGSSDAPPIYGPGAMPGAAPQGPAMYPPQYAAPAQYAQPMQQYAQPMQQAAPMQYANPQFAHPAMGAYQR
jgi:hypothetical protein